MKAYLLSYYQENGAECVRVTLDPAKLPEMLKALCGEHYEECALARMQELLREGELLDGIDLSTGWGGPMLHIVELE